jgi:3'(2'),5'-bisphosphate nucleotidase
MPQGDAEAETGLGAVDAALLETIVGIAFAGGRAALNLDARRARSAPKPDETAGGGAEARARRLILDALAEIAPHTHAVAKGESLSAPADALRSEYFLVDPLDAGDAFDPAAPRGGEFTINIAVIQDGVPVAGVVFAPGLERLWAGRPGVAWSAPAAARTGVGPGRPIQVRAAPEGGVTAVAGATRGAPELDAFLSAYSVTDVRTAGAALRFCLLADGSADLYPQLAAAPAWSVAAGDAILRAAGGRTVTLDGASLDYDPSRFTGGGEPAVPPFVALASVGLKTPTPA